MPNALIVEDEPEANKLLAMLVQLRGFQTESAFSGGEALAAIERRRPDIIFLDLMLPDMNGYDVCKSLKTRKATTLIPVVMVTARVAVENRIESYCIGADHYVAKPYTPDQIFQAIDDAGLWRQKLETPGISGEILFESRDDGESLRRLAQFRSEVLAGTPLEVDAVCGVNETLRRLWALADAWGRAHRVTTVASLAYRVEDDRLVLVLRDLSGWLRDDPQAPALRFPEELARGRFDEISAPGEGRPIALVVRFPATLPGGPDSTLGEPR